MNFALTGQGREQTKYGQKSTFGSILSVENARWCLFELDVLWMVMQFWVNWGQGSRS